MPRYIAFTCLVLWSGGAMAQEPVPPGAGTAAPAAPPPASVPVDVCSMVQCPANSTCLVTNAGPLCACNPGYAPHGATGCKKEGCGSDAECGEGRICRSGRCLAGDTIEKYRRTGKSMLIPGLVLMPIGVAFVGLGVYFWYQARTCTTDPFFGIRSCHTNTGTTEYRLYAGFMISGVLALGAGVALTIVGAVKLRRARELELGLSPVVPFVTAVPGGGMAGIVMRF